MKWCYFVSISCLFRVGSLTEMLQWVQYCLGYGKQPVAARTIMAAALR